MGIGADGYLQQLLRLLPEGPVWPRDIDSVIAKILGIPATALGRVDSRAADLILDMDPRTTDEMLGDWELAYGLPDECTDATNDPDIRRRRLVQKVVWQGGQSAPFFIALVESLGYAGATIDQFQPFVANSECDDAINGGGWNYAWRVNVPANATINTMNATSPCNAALATWGDDALLCILSAYKPAHTILFVAYGDFT